MSSRATRVLFVGDGWLGSNARSLAEGFRVAGADVVLVDTTRVSRPARPGLAWGYSRVAGRRWPGSVRAVHEQVEDAVRRWHPDVVFCFKTIHLDQTRLLETAGRARTVHYSADDVSNPDNLTPEYLASEGRWDLVVTTKLHNVEELARRGARDVLFVRSAYDPAWHHPVARRSVDRYAVGFVGNMRPDRRDLVADLATRYAGAMTVMGPGWARVEAVRRSGAALGPAAYGEDLSIAVAGITANLVLLNSENRDTHTCRTFEVPAAGGLFVGERTHEHEALLAEGEEAFFFGDRAELHDVLERLQGDPALADRVSRAGHRAVVGGRHSYADRASQILEHLDA